MYKLTVLGGEPIGAESVRAGTDPLWSGLPSLIVVMFGGFTTNFIWCVGLNIKNGSGYEYLATKQRHPADAIGGNTTESTDRRIPLLRNFIFCALAGITWYFQFFFYSMGHTKMGGSDPEGFGFSSWTLHMASIIIFSTMWGWIFHEWKGSSKKAHRLIAAGIVTLLLSTIVIGLGTWMKGSVAGH